MGVTGLWEVLKPTGKVRSLTDIAVSEGFKANPGYQRGFRIGIDASIWLFHAEYGKEGENPHLRTIFFRCATLMKTTFLPVFVFDGPKRPDIKRGKKISKVSNKLIPAIKKVVEAFGFEWRTAPGEAEAELAYLNSIGAIDGVLSDDVDNFLFGAMTVIRNPSNKLSGNRSNPALNAAGKDDGNHTRVYRMQDITNQLQLTRGGLILIGLLSGGDYDGSGLPGCGMVTAVGLAKGGYGDALFDAAYGMERHELEEFLVEWRQDIRSELKTDAKKLIGRKQPSLAKKVPDSFPDIDILLSYVKPITTETMGRASDALNLRWEKDPDLSAIAGVCEMYFEWGYKESIIKRFRTLLWHPIVLRILRRAAMDKDDESGRSSAVPSTPRKKKGLPVCGTPSKMIASRFSSMTIATPSRHGLDSDDEDDGERLILGIRSSRNHVSTGGLLEYRLEVAPAQLVRLAEAGIQGLRQAPDDDEWASDGSSSGDDDGGKKSGKKKAVDPQDLIRVWMPACMVEIVEPGMVEEFQQKEEQKLAKKSNKGKKSLLSGTGLKKKTHTATKKKVPGASRVTRPDPDDDDFLYDDDDLPPAPAPKTLPALRLGDKPSTLNGRDANDPSDNHKLPSVQRTLNFRAQTPAEKPLEPCRFSSSRSLPSSSSSSSLPKVRDLTKKTAKAPRQLNDYFTVSKPSTSIQVPKRATTVPVLLSGEKDSDGAAQSNTSHPTTSHHLSSPKRKPPSSSPPPSSEPELTPPSPKKKQKARSVSASRPLSPSPVKPRKNKLPEIIELTDSDDSDDSLPESIVPPLLRAKARRDAQVKAGTRGSRPQISSSDDIIDLT